MKKMVSGLVIATLASIGVAQAEGDVYGGIYYAAHDAGYDEGFSPTSIGGRIGYERFFSEFGNGTGFVAGGEARVGGGMSNSSINDGAQALELGTTYGAYVRLGYSTGIVTPYALIGFTSIEGHFLDVTRGYNNDFANDSLSYGVGLDYNLSERTNIGVEYLAEVDKLEDTDDSINAFNFVTKFKF